MERGVNRPAPKTLREIFEDACPYYLSAGMTYDEFWKGRPRMVIAYRKKMRIDSNKINDEAWLNGRYIHIAVSAAIHNKFRKKEEKAVDYPLEPFSTGSESEAKKSEKKKKNTEAIKALLDAMKSRYDAKESNNGTNQ